MTSSRSLPTSLTHLGWDDHFADLFIEHAAAGLVPARVVRVDRGLCDVLAESGPIRADSTAVVSSDPARTVCTGDWAALRPGPEPELVALLPRRSAITRASVDRTSHVQALAANVDAVVVAVSAASVNAGQVERLLALAWESGALPVVALTKVDVVDHPDELSATVTALAPGVEVIPTSATTGSGLADLVDAVTGTAVLLGPSGAGKSTLANALLGREHMAVNEVRAVDGKGRHTTVHRELLPLPNGGVLIDTPGLRGIGLQDAADGVERVFAEIEEYAQDCRFRDCGHGSEPGCAVQEAIIDGRMDVGRLDRYRKLLRESERAAHRGDVRRSGKGSKAKKQISRDIRAMYRLREAKR